MQLQPGSGQFSSNKMGVSVYRLVSFISPSCLELQSELFFPGNLSRGHKLNWSGWCSVSGSRTLLLDDIMDSLFSCRF